MHQPSMKSDCNNSATWELWYSGMNDCLRVMDAPWQATINKTNKGYSDWFRMYLDYVEVLND